MAVPLLATKLYIPPPRPDWVARPRLLEQLDLGMQQGRRLILISAPAGFGKTALISDWVSRAGIPTAWISLDENDNDLTRFFGYVVSALKTIESSISDTCLALLQTQSAPAAVLENALTLFLNELALVPRPFALILDDYHLIRLQQIHNALGFLLEHMPPCMRLVLISRSDPPIALARLRVRSQLQELRAADLRFTGDEAATFLNAVMHLGITPGQIAALEGRTEGWIAGLQLAALSMKGRDDVRAFVESFTGSNRLVLNYLVEEVLQRQPEDAQEFLLQTCVLERMTASLCNAITGRTDAQSMLERLEHGNLFVIPLDDEGRWYRYHQLFAETLRTRLEQASPERVPELHRRASEWHEGQGHIEDAVSHALAARDYERAARLVEGFQRAAYANNALPIWTRWIQALPRDTFKTRPRFAMAAAWAHIATTQIKPAEEFLRLVESSIGTTADALMEDETLPLDPQVRAALVEVMIARCTLAMAPSLLEFAENIKRLQRVLPLLVDNGPYLHNRPENLRPIAYFNQGIAYQISGNSTEASLSFSKALSLARERNNGYIISMSISHLADLQLAQGRLHLAAETYRAALEPASPFPSPLAGLAHRGLSSIYYEWNELDRAEDELHQALTLAKMWSNWETLLPGYALLARLKIARGDTSGALAAVDELATLAEKFPGTPMQPAIAMSRAETDARSDNASASAAWADTSTLYACDPIPYSREDEGLVLARLLIALERPQEALSLLQRLLAGTEAGGRVYNAIMALALQAAALESSKRPEAASAALRAALTLAEPEGLVRTFVDCGQVMAQLLQRTSADRERTTASPQTMETYTHRLLTAFPRSEIPDAPTVEPFASIPAPSPSHLIESTSPSAGHARLEGLTQRELEVLRLIAQGLTNQEIADKLVITQSTVKKHIENAYAKLEVTSRTQAVARARDLGLID